MNHQPDYYPNSIAIIGMAGRFPKAYNIEQFWHNLVKGVESIDILTDEQLAAVELEFAKVKDDPDYVRARGMLDGIDLFDANFFGLTPREARALDPQHRLWLETAWEALETAAYAPSKYNGAIGVFAGNYYNSYVFYNLMADRQAIEGQVRFRSLDSFINLISNDKDYLPTRTSYLFDLKGPSVNVQTACSTSLVAVAQACQSLLNYESDICLAGGVCIAVPQERGYLYQEGGMTSADGHCRPYDANANGTVFSSGVGVVVLKRLEEALADGDHITAIIRATALNNDGAHKVSYTAPSVDGQAEVIALAHAIAGVDPETITYVEGHGTATPLGDPIEVAGLTKAFRKKTDKTQFCGLGSVKSNVGHLDAASGVTGLIKTALALHHEQIPATLHFEQPNPEIDLANSPFYVVNELTPWPKSATPRRAGVSSFGVGGTNAHVVLEEAPEPLPSGSSRPRQLLLLSGKTETAVSTLSHHLAHHLETASPHLANVAYTLTVGRTDHPYRRAIVADSHETAVSALRQPATASKTMEKNPPVVFMFPGQGAQHVNMGRELYETEPIFREAVDHCAEILRPLLNLDLRDLLYPETDTQSLAAQLEQTAVAQPAIFTIEYALAQLWLAWGVRPSAMVGHSVGEFTAACLAGIFSLEDALTLLATRARLMQAVAPGKMRAVRLSEADLLPHLTDGVSLAAHNAPNLCVVSGPSEAITAFDQRLESQGIATIELHTSHAFHSAMMDDVLPPFAAAVANATPPHTPHPTLQIPILSTLTGTWLTPAQAVDPAYWAQQLRQPVRFSQAVRALQEIPGRIYLEVGPGSTLSTAVRQHPTPSQTVITSLGHAKTAPPALQSVLEAAGRLWQAGVTIDWAGFYQDETRHRLPLPTYPFERQRYWVDPPPLATAESTIPTTPMSTHDEGVTISQSPNLPISQSPFLEEETMPTSRRQQVAAKLGNILHELSGMDFAPAQYATPFIELGFDSLTLTQVSSSLKSELGVAIKFRELLENVSTVDALADYCLERVPAEMFAAPVVQPVAQAVAVSGGSVGVQTAVSLPQLNHLPTNNGSTHPPQPTNPIQHLIEQQLQIMQQQLQLLGSGPSTPTAAPQIVEKVVVKEQKPARFKAPAKTTAPETLKPGGFGPYSPVRRRDDGNLTHNQKAHLDHLIELFVSRTKLSKDHAQQYRPVLAYPRSIYGYRRLWKEMVYQLVAARSKGSRLWDIDGNEYVDMTLGFGINFLGHSPDFVTKAMQAELEKGVEIGPHSRLAGEIATMIRQMTGVERVSFCNTGSEAVMAAVRIARTVTGREKIVYFSGDYHGVFDEVLARPQVIKGELHTMPAVPGILPASVENIYILDYGVPESLDFIREHANELAAVLVEPVQSRHPYNRPVEFLRQLRHITRNSGTALILDEIVTGFRVHQGGIQKAWGIEADIVTYGKIVGGGMPIGIVGGKAAFMNALDGGQWNYGDDSEPEADLTFFAGTFIRHPLAMAAAHATMRHLLAEGPQLQERVNQRTTTFVETMNAFFENVQVPIRLRHHSSWFRFDYPADMPYMELIAFHLLTKGVYVLSLGQNFFFSTQHSDDDIAFVTQALQASILELQTAGFLPASDKTPFPLTEAQQEIWLASQMGETASCAYNETLTVRLTGRLEAAALVEAVQTVLRRHDALHMRFAPDGEWQRRADEIGVAVPVLDWSGLSGNEQAERVKTAVSHQATTPFDLVNGPLVRPQLIKLSANEHLFLFCGHHIAFDGWSFGLIVDELKTVYNALLDGQGYTLPDPESYRTYAQFEAALQASDEGKTALAYWLEQLREAPSHTQLPTDRPHPATKSYSGAAKFWRFDSDLAPLVKQAATKAKVTTNVFLLATYQLLLHQLSGQEDLVVGYPIAGQLAASTPSLVGHCVNVLPLRVRVNGRSSFTTFLKTVQDTFLNAYDHQATTFGTILRHLRLPRDPSRTPLVQVVFNPDRKLADGKAFRGIETSISAAYKQAVNWDMFLNVIEDDSSLTASVDYSSAVLDEATIVRWLGQYESLLRTLATNPDQLIGSLPLLSGREQAQIQTWNNTDQPHNNDRQIQQMVAEQVAKTPATTAVFYEGQTLTYAELDQRANQLAHLLRRRGVTDGTRVGILMDRSLEMVVAVLGVLKAGGTYIPTATDYPPERIAFILEDSDAHLLLTQPHIAPTLRGVVAKPVVELDSSWQLMQGEKETAVAITADPDAIACIIYTSGSTGKPKGVLLAHRGLCNYMQWKERHFRMTGDDAMIMKAPFGFDAATWEIFSPLTVGGRVVIAKQGGQMDIPYLIDLMARQRVTMGFIVPTQIRALLDNPNFAKCQDLRVVMVGGEAFPEDLRDKFRTVLPRGELHNVYGPTETTIVVMSWDIAKAKPEDTLTPIGYPIDNTRVYVLNETMQPVPVGVVGELYIGGVQVGHGYLKRPELTAERFVKDPFSPQGMLYKTGDNVRYRPDGAIEYLGRADFQVKLRGQRVELGEIETAVQSHPAMKQVLVVVRDEGNNDKRLVAYYTLAAGGVDPSATELRDHLRRSIPEFMIPNAFVVLGAFPTTPNGKLDRAALPAPSYVREEIASFTAPRNPLESTLAELWRRVLKVEKVSVYDNFFDLGGHSLLALRLFDQIAAETGKKLPLATLFEAPTVAQLAARLADDGWQPKWSALVPIQPTGHKRPFFHVAPYLISVLNFTDLSKYLDSERPFYGIQPLGLEEGQPIHTNIEEMAAYYIEEIKTVQPHGPYLIGGHCAGAWVAYEMACQLEATGEKVEYLGIISSQAPQYVEPGRNSLAYLSNRAMFYLKDRRLLNAMAWKLKMQAESKLLLKYSTPQNQRILAVRDAHEAAYEAYEPTQGYTGPMSIVRATEQLAIFGNNDDWVRLWEELTVGPVEYADVEGIHATLLQEPSVAQLGEHMRRQIEAVGERVG